MNHRSDLQELKSRVDLSAVIRSSGVKLKPVGRNLMGLCPFHQESTASLSVNGPLWNCFGCDAGGDILDWLQLKEKLAFPQAVCQLEELALQFPAEPAKPTSKKPVIGIPRLMGQVAERYHRRFLECPEAQEYLRSRGLDSKELWEAFRVGYCDGTMGPTIGEGSEQLQQVGLVNDKGREHFLGCIVVPLEHPDIGVMGFYGRKIGADPVAHLYLPGPKRGVLHWQAVKQARRLVVAESVLDAFSLWMAGVRDVTCLYGANSWPTDLDVLLHRYGTAEVALCLDGDDTGQKAAAKYLERLQAKNLRCSVVSLPQGQDPNEVLRTQGASALKNLVWSAPVVAPPQPVREDRSDGFVISLGEVRYQITLIPPFVGRLKCSVVGIREQRMFTDKLDLYIERNRIRCAALLMRTLEIQRSEAESHLHQIAREAIEWAEQHKSGPSKQVRPQAPELSPEETEAALEFLRHPQLIQAILEDCEALGFVGEEKSKLLAYLIGVSRKLPAPLSGVVVSASGAGKSTLARVVEQLVPPEDVLFYTRITPQALYYSNHDMRGLILMLEERAGGEGADYAIRALQSSNKLKLKLPVKDPTTGQTTAQDIEVLGPIAYFETTTNPEINPENASRCFELFMDESPEQTARIHQQQRLRRLLMDYDPEEMVHSVCAKHHNAQRLLKPMRVVIPYATKLRFPHQWVRTRRDNERFLCLIEAIAFLHQYQREQGEHLGKPYVVATIDDYRLAYRLAQQVLCSTLHELSHEGQELWQVLVPFVTSRCPQNPQSVVFSFKDLRGLTHSLSNYRLRTLMNELVELEYVTLLAGQNGKSFLFQLLTTDIVADCGMDGLTTPDELQTLIKSDLSKPFE